MKSQTKDQIGYAAAALTACLVGWIGHLIAGGPTSFVLLVLINMIALAFATFVGVTTCIQITEDQRRTAEKKHLLALRVEAMEAAEALTREHQ